MAAAHRPKASSGPIIFSGGRLTWLTVYMGIWEEMPTNKIIAELFTNDSDGVVMANFFPPRLKADGFTQVDPGRFTLMTPITPP